ncbi:MAG: DNA-3-methyladenine glycosylase [Deltaproteobacteria bacterium]|nr:DNA-3-methyladenine glycosylase [Deltaproteobacteria bacterium]
MPSPPPLAAPLPRAFFARDPRRVARDLLGKVLVHRHRGVTRAARIVETEAYLGERDQASHARFGPTRRAAVMFGPPGVAYVYLVYGMHHCMNVVTGEDGAASAVLLRAAEPLRGCLAVPRGPGKLCQALAIRRERHDGMDLCGPRLFVADGPPPAEPVRTSARIGVTYAGAWARRRLRWYLGGNPWVSGGKAAR